MKRFISLLLLIMFITFNSTTKSIGQIGKNTLPYQSTSSLDLFSLFSNKKYFIEMRLNDVNIKAVRDFVKNFKHVEHEKWYRISDGFVASFTQDSIQMKVFYGKKGRRHCVLSAFRENQVPNEIRSAIKSKYYDYDIIVAYEIKFGNDSSYIAKIETATSLKIIQLLNGEIQLKANYIKSKF